MSDEYIEDDEDTVDTKKKQQILQRKDDVNEWEMELYTQVSLGEMDLEQADQLWGYRVRSYLKEVEPLFTRTNLEDATEVYEELDLGGVRVDPPPELTDSNVEIQSPVSPKYVPIDGIEQVIEAKQVSAEWEVQIRNSQAPKRRDTITRSNVRPISYPVLEGAVRSVDKWLQLNGIGVNVDAEPYESEDALV